MKQWLMIVANAVAVFAGLLLIWQLALWIFHVPPYMLPSPLAVTRVAMERFSSLFTSLPLLSLADNKTSAAVGPH